MINRKNLNNKESVKILDKIFNPYLKALFAFKNDPDYHNYYNIVNYKYFTKENLLNN